MLANLIRAQAINERAHVVGHSLGSHVTKDLLTKYPGGVNAAFVSGFAHFPQTNLTRLLPYFFSADNRYQRLIPRQLVSWLMDDTDLGFSGPCTLDLCKQIALALHEQLWPESWAARTLIVAVGKSGVLPSSDRVDDARKLGVIGMRANDRTLAVVHWGMRHPWNRQAPMLFAETVRAWFEDGVVGEGF